MKIAEIYSHLNGLEYLQIHLPELWEEIQEVIEFVDAEACKTKKSKEKKKVGKLLYSPIEMNKKFKELLENKNWKESRTQYYVTANAKMARETLWQEPAKQKEIIEASGSEALYTYNQTDLVKERVAVEVQFGKYFSVAYDLFVKHMAFYVGDKIDLGIEILPMKVLASEMSSGVPYYEGELYNIIRQGRNTPAVPLIIIGISQ
ncbi:MAG: restriction endonuclease [Lachnospiraceae bacterium]|nr:restriction endonuclease [Lachnospiraceae bacterium]